MTELHDLLDYDNDHDNDHECCRFQLIGFSVPCYPLKTRKPLCRHKAQGTRHRVKEFKKKLDMITFMYNNFRLIII